MTTNLIRATAFSAIVAAALGTITLVGPAHAAEAPRVSVSFADLDLTSEAGRATLERRIDRAAEAACAGAKANTGTRIQSTYRACLKEARGNVAKQVERAVASARTDSVAEAK